MPEETLDLYAASVAEMDARAIEFIDQWGLVHGFEYIVNAAHAYVVARVRRDDPDADSAASTARSGH